MLQTDALKILQTGANAFLTGEPGSGKTHTVNAYIRWLQERGIEPSITASTGIAATHVGGMTIHSWSGIGIKEYLTEADVDAITSKEHVARRIAKARVLIIDEVSMLSGSVLSMAERVVREIKRNHLPFGGMQVVLVGDFFQLPPISKTGTPDFAFMGSAWRALNPLTLYLSEQHRTEDPKFLDVLTNIRKGETDPNDVGRIVARESLLEDVPADIPRLYTHNADVDKENAEKLAALPGSAKTFRMETSGAPLLVEGLKRGCLSPEALSLKEGAVVMFTKNSPFGNFVNGTIGTIVRFERGTNYPVVETRDGREITVAQHEWVVEEGGKIKAKIVQMPLKLAWAITVHKSQGQSLDAAAVDLSRAFEYGQGYVALSRLRTLQGLHLLGWSEQALKIHPDVSKIDAEFRAASEEARTVFAELEESGERAALVERFVKASGGSIGKVEKKEKRSTYEETLALIEEGNSLEAVAKARGITLDTVADHVEKLVLMGKLSKEDVRDRAAPALIAGLPDIFEAFEDLGTERLAPVFSRLKKRYGFAQLKLARALYGEERS